MSMRVHTCRAATVNMSWFEDASLLGQMYGDGPDDPDWIDTPMPALVIEDQPNTEAWVFYADNMGELRALVGDLAVSITDPAQTQP